MADAARVGGKGLWIGLLVVVLALVALRAWRREAAPSRAPLLDATLRLRSEGTHWTFTLDAPAAVLLDVEMPAGCRQEARLTIAPLRLALRPEPVYEPAAASEHALGVPPTGLAGVRLDLARAGPYVLYLEPIPMAMAHEGAPPRARVVLRRDG